jgi:sensor histidine kinase YesM
MTFCYVLVFYQIYESFEHLASIGHKLRIPENSAFFKLLNHHQSQIVDKLFIAAGISYVFSFIVTIKISHKVSGPIYRLKEFFKELKDQGFTSDLTFRDGDYYSDLPETINQGLKKIRDNN